MPSTVDHVVEELNVKKKPVVVFVWFRETVTAIRMLISGRHLDTGAMISCQSITGDITDYLVKIVTAMTMCFSLPRHLVGAPKDSGPISRREN